MSWGAPLTRHAQIYYPYATPIKRIWPQRAPWHHGARAMFGIWRMQFNTNMHSPEGFGIFLTLDGAGGYARCQIIISSWISYSEYIPGVQPRDPAPRPISKKKNAKYEFFYDM